ncbi:MAG: precorrin-6y C5,15-methyltransferase (decarboxylating) subunit CbiE [Halanaerobiales bacterium]|nr:precorrin-6y C5,15-methyltransferase (decarboxylating) subunit CbiE [Halanaerobiales bacterium]
MISSDQRKKKIRVIGVGPGSEDYLLPMALKKARECDLLFGSKRALRLFEGVGVPFLEYSANFSDYIDLFSMEKDKLIGIVVAGDPGFYSLLAFLRKHFPPESLEVIPGVSSVQYLFAKIATPWQNYYLTSCHGRELGNLKELVHQHGKLALLTDSKLNPTNICKRLLSTDDGNSSFENYRVIVGENLSYPDEKITIGSVKEIALMDQFGMSVVIIDNEW